MSRSEVTGSSGRSRMARRQLAGIHRHSVAPAGKESDLPQGAPRQPLPQGAPPPHSPNRVATAGPSSATRPYMAAASRPHPPPLGRGAGAVPPRCMLGVGVGRWRLRTSAGGARRGWSLWGARQPLRPRPRANGFFTALRTQRSATVNVRSCLARSVAGGPGDGGTLGCEQGSCSWTLLRGRDGPSLPCGGKLFSKASLASRSAARPLPVG